MYYKPDKNHKIINKSGVNSLQEIENLNIGIEAKNLLTYNFNLYQNELKEYHDYVLDYNHLTHFIETKKGDPFYLLSKFETNNWKLEDLTVV